MRCCCLLGLLAAGCGFNSPPGGEPIPGGGISGTWTFDSAAAFGAPGHAVQDMTVEARGALTPSAYTYGGLVGHGLQGMALWQHGDTSWAKLDGKTPSGAGLWYGDNLDNMDVLAYLGITDKAKMTVWFEGEVWLDAGSDERFKLTGDDVAFFQIAPPGTTAYSAVSDDNDTEVPVPTPVVGWYPIRIGFANGTTSSRLDFTHSESGGPFTAWTRERLRARTSQLNGALRTVFSHQILGGGQGPGRLPIAYFDQRDLLKSPDFDSMPQGAGPDDWSARYLGQVYVTQPGTYTMRVSSDDGNRARLGTMLAQSRWARGDGVGPQDTVTMVSAPLTAGWNDVIVDYNQVTGSERLRVELQGPDFPSFVAVPRDRLRPVESADDRLSFSSDDMPDPIRDNGGAANPGTATMTIAGYTGETVTAIDLTYQIDSPRRDEIRVDLETPAGPASRLTIVGQDDGAGDGNKIAQLTISGSTAGLGALLGGPANGTWKIYAYDATNGGGGSELRSVKLTLHTTGGPDKVAKTASWTSQVLDAQTDVIAVDGVTWDERLPAGATLGVFVRGCQQANCSDGTWPAASIAKATPFTVGQSRYLQLRVDLTSDGTLEPELRSLAVMYRRAAP